MLRASCRLARPGLPRCAAAAGRGPRRPRRPPPASGERRAAAAANGGGAGVPGGGPQCQPPLPVRAGLVGATTALLTPAFPVIGFNQLVFRFLDPGTRMVLTGGSTMLFFSLMTLLPNAFYYAPLLLPFAVGNGLAAAGLYAAVEAAAGGPRELAGLRLGPVPLAGPLIGAAVALCVPFVYPFSWALVYPDADVLSEACELLSCISNLCFGPTTGWIVWPCLVSTGLVSGLIIDLMLRPLILGVAGVTWQRLAGSVLLASGLGMLALYSTSMRTQGPQHLGEVDVHAPELQGWIFYGTAPCFVDGERELLWVPRLSLETGDIFSEAMARQTLEDGNVAFSPEGRREAGLEKAARAQALRDKAQDPRVRCYPCRRGAYFDMRELIRLVDTEVLQESSRALPVRGAVVTDALVLLVAGSVDQARVRGSLERLAPLLREPAQRDRSWNPFRRPAAQSAAALLQGLELHAAQLRELLRLEAGAASRGSPRAGDLADALAGAGIDVARARQSLRDLRWEVAGSDAERARDLGLLGIQQRRSSLERVGSVALLGAALGALAVYGTASGSRG